LVAVLRAVGAEEALMMVLVEADGLDAALRRLKRAVVGGAVSSPLGRGAIEALSAEDGPALFRVTYTLSRDAIGNITGLSGRGVIGGAADADREVVSVAGAGLGRERQRDEVPLAVGGEVGGDPEGHV
jgi:hypothetical protein